MNHLFPPDLRRGSVLLALVAAVAVGSAAFAAGAASDAAAVPGPQPSETMNTFVIIFRQDPNELSEADRQRRTEETRIWAREQNAAGHELDPRMLDAQGFWLSRDGETHDAPAAESRPVTALLFILARDLGEAVEVARAHPAVRFGAGIEVRPWAPPQPAP